MREAARILDLEEFLDRKPKHLSGGQRQRVAMGRAIVRHPQVFLMDEPLSNLDAKLRVQTRAELADLQARLGVTTVYVTHDQVEAMTMGHRVAILDYGVMQQVDTPGELYRHPGQPLRGRLHRVTGDEPAAHSTSMATPSSSARPRSNWTRQWPGVVAAGVALTSRSASDRKACHWAPTGIPATVVVVEELGSETFVFAELEHLDQTTRVRVRVDADYRVARGDNTHVEVLGPVHFFGADGDAHAHRGRAAGLSRRAASYDFSGSIALVTGAGGDIGRVTAVRLASSGAALVLTDLEGAGDALERTRAACADAGDDDRVVVLPADVTDPSSVADCFEAGSRRFGTPDLVFNNAGVQGELLPLQDYPVDEFPLVMSVNVFGVFNVLREAARRLRADGRPGAIVNSASMAGVEGAANMPAYSASKGAVMSITRSASKDFAPLGIRVNAISPAFIGEGLMWDRQVTSGRRWQTRSTTRPTPKSWPKR